MSERGRAGRAVRAAASAQARTRRAPQAARNISESDARALLDEHVVIDVVEERDRFVLLGRVEGRALIAVVADDELDDATVLVSVYEPDEEHGWTTERIERMLTGGGDEDDP